MWGSRQSRIAIGIVIALAAGTAAHADGLEPGKGSGVIAPGAGSSSFEPPATPDTAVDSGGLDLDSADAEPGSVTPATSSGTDHSTIWALLAIVAMTGIVGAVAVVGRRRRTITVALDLHAAPLSGKMALTLLLLIYGATHVVAAITVYLDSRVVYATTEEYFRFIKPARLSALSHAHLMAIATMDGIVAMLYAWSRRSGGLACAVIAMTFVGIAGDVASWWLIKYAGAGFELMSAASGIAFSLGFSIMTLGLLRNAWWRNGARP